MVVIDEETGATADVVFVVSFVASVVVVGGAATSFILATPFLLAKRPKKQMKQVVAMEGCWCCFIGVVGQRVVSCRCCDIGAYWTFRRNASGIRETVVAAPSLPVVFAASETPRRVVVPIWDDAASVVIPTDVDLLPVGVVDTSVSCPSTVGAGVGNGAEALSAATVPDAGAGNGAEALSAASVPDADTFPDEITSEAAARAATGPINAELFALANATSCSHAKPLCSQHHFCSAASQSLVHFPGSNVHS
eukprot:CAMPEP_0172673130 /NCGR_PEP_ID=MMETSP1074-20121228/11961_1 /TAXON_ID=2916 /ORGANISM="Ceratium fusus, Strain PA161109" /LENGTH=249 /DNA_ID=CAMNT_0013490397 /DNA_START=1516 /DNA_END=2265 /DNA_ORIENTATION=-